MVVKRVFQLSCIGSSSFQRICDISTDFPYVISNLSIYSHPNLQLIKEVAESINSELLVLVENVRFRSLIIDFEHFIMVSSRLDMLIRMIKNTFGQAAFKVWKVLDSYSCDLQVVRELLVEAN